MNREQMAQMAAMMQGMGGSGGESRERKDNGGVTWVSTNKEGTQYAHYLDSRYYPRFSEETNRSIGALRSGRPVTLTRGGSDPFQKYLHETRKTREPINFEQVTHTLFALPANNLNFNPLKEVLTHPYWSDQDKVRVMREVLQYHHNVDFKEPGAGRTALQYAFLLKDPKARVEAVTSLIQHGADTNRPDSSGFTPLHYAFEHGSSDVVPLMLELGAKFSVTGKGRTPAELALNHFEEQLRNPGLSQQHFEDSLTEYYKSMARIKKHGLHGGPFDFKEHKERLLKACSKYPGYGPFVDTMAEQLDRITKVDSVSKLPPPRAFTNPGWGLNEPIANTYQHPWLGVLSFMDRWNDGLERKVVELESKSRVQICLNDLNDLTKPHVIEWLAKDRKKFSLDYKLNDPKRNPFGDTLLTKCMREGRFEAVENLIALNVDLHAVDAKGNSALHLLAANCSSKEQFLLTAKQLIGVPGEKGRVGLLGENIADWHLRDAQGRTFVDVLRDTHPEWIKDLVEQTGINPKDVSIPEWSPSHILMLGGPEEVLKLSKNPDPLKLEDKTVPVLESLSPLASTQERYEHVQKLCAVAERVQRLKNDASPEQQAALNMSLVETLNKQEPEIKMQALVAFAVSMDKLDSNKILAQNAILKTVAHTMASGSADERRNVFEVFDKAGQDVQFNIVAMLESQSVLMSSELKDAPEDEQKRLSAAIDEFKQSASLFSDSMSREAQSKYGIVLDNDDPQSINEKQGPKK